MTKMIIRSFAQIILTIFAVILFGNVNAQIYDCDSLRIEIMFKNRFLVKEYKDLNIEVAFLAKPKGNASRVYEMFEDSYQSTFGNCYFQLFKFDSVMNGFKDITFDVMENKHPPKDFRNEGQILKYDLQKSPLGRGKKRILTFNLFDFIHTLRKGIYSLRIYIRVGDSFGYNRKGEVIANGIQYIQSPMMNFEVLQDITWRIPLQ